jgi:hypothetical protein
LSSPVELSSGERFSVAIGFLNSSYTYPVCIEGVETGYSSAASSNSEESYIAQTFGPSWYDLGLNWPANVCIKALTDECLVPPTPGFPSPADGATGVALDADLDWDDSLAADSYDVYFGSSYPPTFAANVAVSQYDPGALVAGTAYFWKVEAKNTCGTTSGPEWDFITQGTIVQHTLTIASGTGGTTDPVPGAYPKNSGDVVQITAVPETGYEFDQWTGDVLSGDESDNPLSVVMDSAKTITATFEELPPEISLSTTQLNFGAVTSGEKTSQQQCVISNTGGGTLSWSISDNKSWLSCSPTSGTGDSSIAVSVDTTGLTAGTYSGQITATCPQATNSPQYLSVTLRVYNPSAESSPFGKFETPTSGATVSGNIPVTGWALDDVEVIKVELKRSSHPSDPPGVIGPDGLVFIWNAYFVKNARPDVAAAYPDYPLCDRAGWGCMVLTNFLPNSGNGTFTLYAFAYDANGNKVELGQKVIHADNANRTKPFGAIDTPALGQVLSGTTFTHFAWALTPLPKTIPKDGSTIWVWIDGVPIGHPNYNQYRSDIATLFPGYNNSDGAVGVYHIDLTPYENGIHILQWSITDDDEAADGLSRYYEIQNLSSGVASLEKRSFMSLDENPTGDLRISANLKEIGFGEKSGFRNKVISSTTTRSYGDKEAPLYIEIEELERIVVELQGQGGTKFIGWGSDETRGLPIGSTLDRDKGIFYWSPGPGFLGKHLLHFAVTDGVSRSKPAAVLVNIIPKKYISRIR